MQSAVFDVGVEGLVGEKEHLVCERKSVFALLTVSAGMMGAYTFNLRGGVFCNAQTANVVLMAMAIGQGNWLEGGYYLLPISAYLAGAFLSEILPSPVRRFGFLRWDTMSLIHISEPTRHLYITYAVFFLKKKNLI